LDVHTVYDGREALAAHATFAPDLVILDLMLPGLDGFEVLRTLRGRSRDLPVIVLSARGEEQDKIRGFRLDADQYVTKPFSLLELLERVHALLRRRAVRAEGNPPETKFSFGTVEVDTEARVIANDGEEVALSPTAFDVLLALLRREGRVASRVELLREVWGYGPLVLSRTVDSHVMELRRKLERDPADPQHIVTVYKIGYRFQR
jgi:DNA-binding response OmpR family regulator